MDCEEIEEVLNARIFQGDKRALITKVARYPERYMGLFRPTKPRAKLIQNLLQSHEIRFGDAMEEVIRKMLSKAGFQNIEARWVREAGSDKDLDLDQYFTDGDKFYLIEQKVRDDHDSSKKSGQVDNFEAKVGALYDLHGNRLVAIMYFIDPDLKKNRNYYQQRMEELRGIYSDVEFYLFYGAEFFAYLQHPSLWGSLLNCLFEWRQSLPELPEVNMDIFPQDSFQELRVLPLPVWRKFLSNEKLWEEGIAQVLFETGRTLSLLRDDFRQESKKAAYRKIADLIEDRLEKYYGAI